MKLFGSRYFRKSRHVLFIIILLAGLMAVIGCSSSDDDSGGTSVADTTSPTFKGIAAVVSTDREKASVSWMPAEDNVTSATDIAYDVHYSTTTGFTASDNNKFKTFTNATSCTVTGLQADTTYYIVVKAKDEAGNTTTSEERTVKTSDVAVAYTGTTFNTAESLNLPAPSISGDTYTFTKTIGSTAPEVGSVLVGEDSEGKLYLRIVDSVSETSDSIIVVTSAGSLSDVIDTGTISSSITLNEPDAGTAVGASFDPTSGFSSDRKLMSTGALRSRMTWPSGDLSAEQIVYPDESSGIAADSKIYSASTEMGELTLNTSVDFKPEFITYAKIDGGSIVEGEVSGKGTFTMEAELSYNFEDSQTVNYTKHLFTRTWTSNYYIGTMPVHQEITMTVDAQFTATSQTTIVASTTGKVSSEVKLGLQYDNGSWSMIKNSNFTKSLTVSARAQGGVTAEVRLIPNLEVKFYKVAAAGLSVEPYLKGEVEAEIVENADLLAETGFADYRFTKMDASIGIDVKTYAELKVLCYTIARYPAEEGSKLTLLNLDYPLFSLPTLSLSGSGPPNINAPTYTLTAVTSDGTNNAFDVNSCDWAVYPEGTITPDPSNPKIATFQPTSHNQTYTIYFIGNGAAIGEIGRQFTSVELDMSDSDMDDMADAWETFYGLSPLSDLDADDDNDSDTIINSDEYANGTNPIVANVVLSGISLSPSSGSVNINSTYDLSGVTVTADYTDASSHTVSDVTWSVDSGSLGTVDGSTFTAPSSAGTTTLVCTYIEDEVTKTAELNLTITVPVFTLSGITLSSDTAGVFTDMDYDLSAITVTANYDGKDDEAATGYTWSVSSGGGSVSGNTFTAGSTAGTTVLTCSYTEGDTTVTADVTVTVSTLVDVTYTTSSYETFTVDADGATFVFYLLVSVTMETDYDLVGTIDDYSYMVIQEDPGATEHQVTGSFSGFWNGTTYSAGGTLTIHAPDPADDTDIPFTYSGNYEGLSSPTLSGTIYEGENLLHTFSLNKVVP